MVFKIPNGTDLVGYTSYYDLYTSTDSYNENSPVALRRSIASGSLAYKSSIINEWNTDTQSILAVNMLFYILCMNPTSNILCECVFVLLYMEQGKGNIGRWECFKFYKCNVYFSICS